MLSDGVHTVTATATDTDGAAGSDSISVTIGDPLSSVAMHVGSVSADTSTTKGGKWNTTVTITVHDPDENLVANATVNGLWSTGASGSDSCTTDSDRQCTINKNNISKRSASVTFTIDGVLHASNTYVPGSNHNPSLDGDGVTAITIVKPQ